MHYLSTSKSAIYLFDKRKQKKNKNNNIKQTIKQKKDAGCLWPSETYSAITSGEKMGQKDLKAGWSSDLYCVMIFSVIKYTH